MSNENRTAVNVANAIIFVFGINLSEHRCDIRQSLFFTLISWTRDFIFFVIYINPIVEFLRVKIVDALAMKTQYPRKKIFLYILFVLCLVRIHIVMQHNKLTVDIFVKTS